ncbi:hypothetical protein J1614_008684 [Plenodomus biglobosus]|nr:hypothetical protein J1614_008684 [Plenodomus biglobosus]
MTVSATATSLTVFAIGPTTSCVDEIGIMPVLVTRPRVGRILHREFADAGLLRELTVSVPVPSTQKEAETPAPVPPELPPGVRVESYGLTVCPPREETLIPSKASSCKFALPKMIAPAFFKAATLDASSVG